MKGQNKTPGYREKLPDYTKQAPHGQNSNQAENVKHNG